MKRISTFSNLLGFLALLMFFQTGFCQEVRKANIQIYRELDNGEIVKKDTLVHLDDLADITHLLGPDEKEFLRTAIFLAEERETRIHSQSKNGVKTISIGQYEGDDWENLDPETQAKVKEAFETANIPLPKEGKKSPAKRKDTYAKTEAQKVEWNGKSSSTTSLSEQKIQIDRNDLTVSQEKALLEALQNEEVRAQMKDMNVEFSLEGRRTSSSKKFYHIKDLDQEEQKAFEAQGLLGSSELLKLKYIRLKQDNLRYTISLQSSEATGEMTITAKDFSGKVLFEDTHLPENGRYEKEVDLGDSFQNFYFLTVTQNGKIVHKRIFPSSEKYADSNSP